MLHGKQRMTYNNRYLVFAHESLGWLWFDRTYQDWPGSAGLIWKEVSGSLSVLHKLSSSGNQQLRRAWFFMVDCRIPSGPVEQPSVSKAVAQNGHFIYPHPHSVD